MMINKNNRNKAYSDIKNNIKILENNLEELNKQVFYNLSNINLLKQSIQYELDILSKSIEELKNPFLLFVIGSGKYGKTTLINSLIKDNLLKVDDIPNTWKLDTLIKAKKEKMDIIYKNSEFLNIDIEYGMNILKEEEMKYKKSKELIRNNFNIYKNSNKRSIDELKLHKQTLEDKYLYKSDIEEVKYYINKNGILENFIIVDTPGLNQNLKSNTKERMINYYNRADGVIWLLDAQNIVAKSSEELIEVLRKEYIIDDKFDNIICVVNKIDVINKNSREKILLKINELYKNKFKDIVLVSSKEALKGYINESNELIESSNIKSLLNSIDVNFKLQSEKIQIKAKYNVTKVTNNKINKLINNYKRELYKNINKYEEERIILEEKLKNLKSDLEIKVDKYISTINLTENNIYDEINLLENHINNSINNVYCHMINLYKAYDKEDLYNIYKSNMDINIIKSKELFQINKYINSINLDDNHYMFRLNTKLSKNKLNYNKEWILRYQIDKFKTFIIELIDNKLKHIESNINYTRDYNFRKNYTDYHMISEHINLINDISNNIKAWEESYGKYI